MAVIVGRCGFWWGFTCMLMYRLLGCLMGVQTGWGMTENTGVWGV